MRSHIIFEDELADEEDGLVILPLDLLAALLDGREGIDLDGMDEFGVESEIVGQAACQAARRVGRVDAGDAAPGCPSPSGRLHHPQDAPDILQVQPPAAGGALPLRPPLIDWRHTGFNVHSHIFIARVTTHIPDNGQFTMRYYGLYANAYRGKVKKASLAAFPLLIVEDELRPIPSRG